MTDFYLRAVRSLHRDAYAGTPDAGRSCAAGCGATIRALDAKEAGGETPPAAAAPIDPAERRTRYAAAMARRDGDTWPTTYEDSEEDYLRRADAAMKVADAELEDARLRHLADVAQQAEPASDLLTLAAALDGLGHLLATSARDWGTYRVDAWLWALLCGWDCEETTHTKSCVHGAMEETAATHGWDDAAVAKVRRYRAAIRRLTNKTPASGHLPDLCPALNCPQEQTR